MGKFLRQYGLVHGANQGQQSVKVEGGGRLWTAIMQGTTSRSGTTKEAKALRVVPHLPQRLRKWLKFEGDQDKKWWDFHMKHTKMKE